MGKKRETDLCWECDKYDPSNEPGCDLRGGVLRGVKGLSARVAHCSFFSKTSVKVTKANDNG
jgi:hypothetical protein